MRDCSRHQFPAVISIQETVTQKRAAYVIRLVSGQVSGVLETLPFFEVWGFRCTFSTCCVSCAYLLEGFDAL